MQKKLIALAVAGLASSVAFADSNVTIYGLLDEGFVFSNGNSGLVTNTKARHALDSGVSAGSRLGFKGAEDLGNGLKAIFEIETGISMDSNRQPGATGNASAGGLFTTSRHSYIGLTGGFGTVVAGRLDGVRYGYYNQYDQFGGTVANFGQMVNQTDRADNAIAYISPSFSGFTVIAAYSANAGLTGLGATTDESVGNVTDGRLYTLTGQYNNGPISAELDYENLKNTKLSVGKLDYTTINAGASYDFGVVKLSGLFDHNKLKQDGTEVAKYDAYMLALSAPIGSKFVVKGMVGRVNDKMSTNQDATKVGLGVTYAVSKRTSFYADAAKINNNHNAAYQINFNPNGGCMPSFGCSAANGTALLGTRAFDIGMKHTF